MHALVPDGVFFKPAGAAPGAPLAFHELPWPEDVDVEALLLTIATLVVKLLRRRGRLDDDSGPDDALGALRAESIASRLPNPPDADPLRRSRRSAFLDGFSLHADTHLHEHDREGLEHLGLPSSPPRLAPARDPPQLDLA